jgi:hypothetical protein
MLLLGSPAFAQDYPYMCGDVDAAGCRKMPWDSLTLFPAPCSSNYLIRGVMEGVTNEFDCAHVVDWPTGTPSDGMCIKYDSGTGGTRWEACGRGDAIVIFNTDYAFLNGELLFYDGS